MLDASTQSDVEAIVEIALLRMDLKYAQELNKTNTEIARVLPEVDVKIKECRRLNTEKRRWNLSALLSVVMAMIAAASAVVANWKQ